MEEGYTDMDRGIDHLVICVADLDAARDTYARLGFTTTPRAIHPFGTGNSLVQLQGNFLELLTVVDESKFAPPASGQFGFGAFNKSFLDSREGMSMLVFEGHGAEADCTDFARHGLHTYDPFHFERKATLPNGEEVTVAFSLAFVTDETMPEAVFFTCQQHAPEYFWKPEFQRHANGASVITETVMVAARPSDLTDLFGGMQGADAVSESAGELNIDTARGHVTVMSPDKYAVRFGAASPGPDSPHFAAFRIAVADLGVTERLLLDNDVQFRQTDDSLQIGPETTFGCVLEFTAED
jgi:hypothetical protein